MSARATVAACDHQCSAAVEIAARWWIDHGQAHRRRGVQTLRERFGLSAPEACQALGMAAEMQHQAWLDRRDRGAANG